MTSGKNSRASGQADEQAENRLLERLREGDPVAADEFVRANIQRALAVAGRFLPDETDAFDAVQDAFVSALKAVPDFQGSSRLSTWLHRIVVNAALMKLRKKKRLRERSLEDLLPRFVEDGHRSNTQPAWRGTPEQLLRASEFRTKVHEKIAELPESYRNVLILRDIQGLSTAETALHLDDSEEAVKTRLHRARQALRKLFEEELSA
ncbi:MAG: sigma-70 family RNA polymerase sigma factor [Phycisphaerae bacterium]|nr:sigma-70 family RNA polymerase sigma factor [Phycisphaerae bacterium]